MPAVGRSGDAARPPGRAGVGLLWLAVLFLLVAPPAFLLAPLVGLLVCSRPATWREWIWLLLGGAAVVYWLAQGGDVAEQSVRALSVLAAGAFVALTLADEATPVTRALTAAGIAVAALAAWCGVLGVSWDVLRMSVTRTLETAFRSMAAQAPGASPETSAAFRQMAEAAPAWAAAMPGLVYVQAVIGMLLAWGLHRRIARHPLGEAAPPFGAFRFSDQLVWVVVAGLALVLFPTSPPLRDVGTNCLVVGGTLYAARGLAVVRSAAGRVPAPTTIAIGFATLVLLPFVLGGLTLLGLADTWLDFRGRLAPPTTGGFNP